MNCKLEREFLTFWMLGLWGGAQAPRVGDRVSNWQKAFVGGVSKLSRRIMSFMNHVN